MLLNRESPGGSTGKVCSMYEMLSPSCSDLVSLQHVHAAPSFAMLTTLHICISAFYSGSSNTSHLTSYASRQSTIYKQFGDQLIKSLLHSTLSCKRHNSLLLLQYKYRCGRQVCNTYSVKLRRASPPSTVRPLERK